MFDDSKLLVAAEDVTDEVLAAFGMGLLDAPQDELKSGTRDIVVRVMLKYLPDPWARVWDM